MAKKEQRRRGRSGGDHQTAKLMKQVLKAQSLKTLLLPKYLSLNLPRHAQHKQISATSMMLSDLLQKKSVIINCPARLQCML